MDEGRLERDPRRRGAYLAAALAQIPRLLGAIDRNPYRPTYGCLDRQFWHYRTASFPSEMYQEGVLPLALVYAVDLPGNRWHRHQRVGQLAAAAMQFAAKSSHGDGSCDDYYPFERALGAAVFSFQASTHACQLLEVRDPQVLGWLHRRARWLMGHDEAGRLANHHALAALGLFRMAAISGEDAYRRAALERIEKVLAWQSAEGWFEEYGGADPGYQTVTLDSLAKCRPFLTDGRLEEPLRRGVAFAREFLHPDASFGGEYGSRGTYHFYPHGMELLAADNADAADLADGFLRSLEAGTEAHFADDRLVAHRLGNLIEAYLDWSPVRPPPRPDAGRDSTSWFPAAGLLVSRAGGRHTVISAARGGIVKHFAAGRHVLSDAGLIVQTADGRIAVSQSHDLGRRIEFLSQYPLSLWERAGVRAFDPLSLWERAGVRAFDPLSLWERAGVRAFACVKNAEYPCTVSPSPPTPLPQGERGGLGTGSGGFGTGSELLRQREPSSDNGAGWSLTVSGPLHWVRFETATPWKQAVFHAGMCLAGRWCRGLVRRLLQRRLITGRRASPIRFTRTLELMPAGPTGSDARLRITDRIELASPRLVVRRMAFGADHQAAYVAASGVYQESVLAAWTDLDGYLAELNSRREVTIVREFSAVE